MKTMKQKKISITEIENNIYGPGGLFHRLITEMNNRGNAETRKLTGKRQSNIDKLKRQFRNPEKYELPKASTIIELARAMGLS
jgi:hypothetical protein